MDENQRIYEKYEQLYRQNGQIPIGTEIENGDYIKFLQHSIIMGYTSYDGRNIPSTNKGKRELISKYLALRNAQKTEMKQAKEGGDL